MSGTGAIPWACFGLWPTGSGFCLGILAWPRADVEHLATKYVFGVLVQSRPSASEMPEVRRTIPNVADHGNDRWLNARAAAAA